MLRRDFFGAAAAIGAAAVPPALSQQGIDGLAKEIETAILAELTGITKVQITYNPDDENVPLMILAFRV